MKKFYRTLFICAWLLLTTNAGQTQVLDIQKYPEKEQPQWLFDYCLEDLSGVDSFHLFKTLDSVKLWAQGEQDKKLLWYVDLFRTVFLSYRRNKEDEERLLLSNKKHFETSPYPEIKGASYFFLGTMYYFRRDFEKSFHYYINANDIFESLGYQNVPLIGHYCYNFFRLYYQVGDYPSAVNFLEEQIKSYRNGNQKHLPFAYNNLGVTYLKVEEVAKAQAMFRKAINLARHLGNNVYIGIASGNYGNTLRLQGHYAESLPYLQTDVALNRDTIPDNSAISCVYIANSYLHLDSLDKANQYLETAVNLNPDRIWSSFNHHYYQTKAFYYKKTGNYRMALLYQDSLLRLRDSLKLGNDLALFKAIALQFKEEKALAERRQKELEKSNLLLTRNLTVAILLVIFLPVITYLYRLRRKERVIYQQRQHSSEEKLRQAEDQLEQYMDAIKEKNKMITQIEANIEKTPRKLVETKVELYTSTPKFTERSLSTEDDWQEFKTLFTLIHPEFFNSLQSRYPDLSAGETRLLALCKLRLSSKEMAAMLGISPQSLRTNRYRLRKKYPNLINDEEFTGFI